MPALIVVHPHRFDNGILKQRLPAFVKGINLPSFLLRDGNKPVYGEKLYDKELNPHNSLGKYGRASLQDNDADRIVTKYKNIFLAGGNFRECLRSTYLSLVRAAERKGREVNLILLTDLIYFQQKRESEVRTLEYMIERRSSAVSQFMDNRFSESKHVNRGLIESSEL